MVDDLYDVTVTRADGAAWPLWDLHGQVVLLVAVHAAAKPTPQLAGVDKLRQTFAAQGFEVVGIPTAGEAVADGDYGVSFPVAAPVRMTGADVHPLFAWLNEAAPGPGGTQVVSGYTKFLIGRDGSLVARFEPAADAKELIAAVQRELAAPVPPEPPRPADPVDPEPQTAASGPAGQPSALEAPSPDPARLPVPAPPADPEADIIEAELVDEAAADLATQVDLERLEADLAQEQESSVGADVMDIAEELRGLEVDSQLLAEHHRDNPPRS